MPFETLRSLQEQISGIRTIVATNETVRASQNAPPPYAPPTIIADVDTVYWKQYDYCAALLRLYATYETFVIQVCKKWLDYVRTNNLNLFCKASKLLDAYEIGVAEILRRSTENRFASINREVLVAGLLELQRQKRTALIGTDAIFSKAPNLKLGDLTSILTILEIPDSAQWIDSFYLVNQSRQTAEQDAEKFLKDFVERRNEAAHGNLITQEIWSPPLIQKAAAYIEAIAAAIAELIAHNMVLQAKANGIFKFPNLTALGEVTEVFQRPQAFILKGGCTGIWIQMPVVVLQNNRCYIDRINSISINGMPTSAWVSNFDHEIGVKMNSVPKKNAKIYGIDGLSWLCG